MPKNKKKKKVIKKKKIIKKKEKKPEKEKIKEKESELVEEVEMQELPSRDTLKQFIQVKSAPPVLEMVTQEEPETASLEQGIGITPVSEKKEPERKYDETLKYDIESEYRESLEKQREMNPETAFQIVPESSINLERVGREQVMPGQEFHIGTPIEMPSAPTSQEKYDLVKVKKAKKFRGETTAFQENLERRYDIK